MGGMGSGGHNHSGRTTTSAHRRLDVNVFNRAGALSDGWRGAWGWKDDDALEASLRLDGGREAVRLRYRVRVNGGPWTPVDEEVAIVWRPCRFGGARPLFACPGCGAEVLHLYGARTRFICRHCARLTYACRRERDGDRARRRANKLRVRLGGKPGMAHAIAPKPNRMRQTTYERLVSRIRRAERASLDELQAFIDRVRRRTAPNVRGFWSARR